MPTPSNLSEQILALPNGAGDMQPVGQTFQVSDYTGTGSFHVPIDTKPGHAGIGPTLSLDYSTHAGSGIAGLGWSLGLASIERRTDRGLPAFDNSTDRFALQGDELLPVGGGYYRFRIEGRFARIRHVLACGRDFWVVSERDGTRVLYGLEPDHRLHDDSGRIAAWYPSKKQDANGNEVLYSYVRDSDTRDTRMAAIDWSGCHRVSFTYETRPDIVGSFRVGFEHQQRYRLTVIDLEVKVGSAGTFAVHKRYVLSYRQSDLTGRSLLTQVAISCFGPDGSRRGLPPIRFGYSKPDVSPSRWHVLSGDLPGGSLTDRDITLVRQSGSGLPDILETRASGHWLRESLGNGHFARARKVSAPAQTQLHDSGTFISDMDGDGWGDLVVAGGERVYAGAAGGGWGAPYVSPQAPSVDLTASYVCVVDLDADGVPDALSASVGSWAFFRNLGGGRWSPPVAIAEPPPVRLDDPRVHLADINGDGIPDLAFVDRSRILVWRGVGLGRFADPVELGNAPDFGPAYDPRAVRWADLTGSGQADLLYLRDGVAEIRFNRAGTAVSDPVAIATVRQSSHGHVEPVDLLGSGASGLLFTDYQAAPGAWRFLELLPGGQPDLLDSIDNGFGGATTIAYGSSAAEWCRDKLAGAPWKSGLPSPRIVVKTVTADEMVTGTRLSLTYSYHHGVYDGIEREFRGFAQVEKIDREAEPGDPGPAAQAMARRWYHTGVDIDLRDRYTPLPEGCLSDEIPDILWARRGLRGLLMREETFALDGNPAPLSVRDVAYRVFPVQRDPGSAHFSFAPLAVRSRITNIERSDERRVVETRTVYDRHFGTGYGLPVQVTETGYGRRGSFTTAHEIAQTADPARTTVNEYVQLDQPDGDFFGPYNPSYLVNKPSLIERFAGDGTGGSSLSRDRFFYDGEHYKGLGYPGSGTSIGIERGQLSCHLTLAFTTDLLRTVYPPDSEAQAAFDASGRFLADGAEHYIHSQRLRRDVHGMVTGALDPNGNESTFEYDGEFALYPVRTVNAAGHPTRLIRGAFPFQTIATLDANGNTIGYGYDASGLPAFQSVQGKLANGDWTGDPPEFPTERYEYTFDTIPLQTQIELRQQRLGAVAAIARYVDGLGRAIQERHAADPDLADGSTRFRVTGWQIYNHKGHVVRIYQPVFSSSSDYAPGDTSTSFVGTRYDAVGRAIRVDYPDGTFETTVYHPWVQEFADRNDNAGAVSADDPRYGRLKARFQPHLNTPKRAYFDGLGRTIAEAEDNGTELHVTRRVLDLKDQTTEVYDARNLSQPTWIFDRDLSGRVVHTHHETASGDRYGIADAAGNPIWDRDASGTETVRAFDVLNRPVSELTHTGASTLLRRLWRYVSYDESSAGFASFQSRNLFGRIEEERDTDGLRFFEYDWRGLTTRASHRFWSQNDGAGRTWDDPQSDLWTTGSNWDPQVSSDDRDAIASYLSLPQLDEGPTLTIETSYDAANRPVRVLYPMGLSQINGYNEAGYLSRIEIDFGDGNGSQPVVESITYDATAQEVELLHGNGIVTSREYDPDLLRLVRIFTRGPGESGARFQDLAYAYDPVGNPMEIADRLAETSFKDNRIIPNTRTFTYDPRYRLVGATGKRHRSVRLKDGFVLVPSPDPNDYEPYSLRYAYDAAGNLISNGEYTPGALQYKSGRVDLFNGDKTEAGTFTDPSEGNFQYDANGSTVHTPRQKALAYTHDRQVNYIDLGGGGQVRYFRHADDRVVRFVNKNGVRALTVYLGPFEYQVRKGTARYTKLVLQVIGRKRHGQVERLLNGADTDSLPRFFHHSDHLGSGHILTDEDGRLLSQEEFFPYGNSSDRRDSRNRYRFIGVERDEDTRLCMTGPRNYDPVSGRFLQPDPVADREPELSAFVYSRGNPVRNYDANGYGSNTFDSDDPPPPEGTAAADAGMSKAIANAQLGFDPETRMPVSATVGWSPEAKEILNAAREAMKDNNYGTKASEEVLEQIRAAAVDKLSAAGITPEQMNRVALAEGRPLMELPKAAPAEVVDRLVVIDATGESRPLSSFVHTPTIIDPAASPPGGAAPAAEGSKLGLIGLLATMDIECNDAAAAQARQSQGTDLSPLQAVGFGTAGLVFAPEVTVPILGTLGAETAFDSYMSRLVNSTGSGTVTTAGGSSGPWNF